MTEAERARQLADDLISRGFYGIGAELGGNDAVDALNLTVRALRRLAETEARTAIAKLGHAKPAAVKPSK